MNIVVIINILVTSMLVIVLIFMQSSSLSLSTKSKQLAVSSNQQQRPKYLCSKDVRLPDRSVSMFRYANQSLQRDSKVHAESGNAHTQPLQYIIEQEQHASVHPSSREMFTAMTFCLYSKGPTCFPKKNTLASPWVKKRSFCEMTIALSTTWEGALNPTVEQNRV